MIRFYLAFMWTEFLLSFLFAAFLQIITVMDKTSSVGTEEGRKKEATETTDCIPALTPFAGCMSSPDGFAECFLRPPSTFHQAV